MTKISAKVIAETLDYEDVTPKAKLEEDTRSVQHYIGTFSSKQIQNGEQIPAIVRLRSDERFPNLKFTNHRTLANGKTEVWLSSKEGQYTIDTK